MPNIEASYKAKYNTEFSSDCKELTYNEIITRIVNIDDDNFGEVLRLRNLELNNFNALNNADSKTKSDYKKRAKKVLTEHRKNKKKNEVPAINKALQNTAQNTINKYLE